MSTKSSPDTIKSIIAAKIAGAFKAGKVNRWAPQLPTERQKLFLSLNDEKEVFYGGAAGGGKSSCLLMTALEYADTPGYSALLLRRTYADLAKPGALMDRAHQWLKDTPAKWNEQRKQWTFPSGATLQFGYLESETDKYTYQGAEYQFIGFDELTQFTESSYTYLFSRLRRLQGSDIPLRVRAASNPGGLGGRWVHERFIPDGFTPNDAITPQIFWKSTPDSYGDDVKRAFIPARLDDNPHLDREEYAESLRELDPVTREQLMKGDWQISERGDIYPMWDEQYHVISWSQFKKVYGVAHLPEHWQCGVFMDNGCLTLDTELLTKEGWKTQDQITVGDSIAGYDWKNKREIVWTPLLNKVFKPTEPLVEIKNKSFRFVATPDHAWIVNRPKKGRRVKDTYRRQEFCSIPTWGTNLQIAGPMKNDGNVNCTPSEAAVLGWLSTEGWEQHNRANFSQKHFPEELIEDLKASGLDWKETKPTKHGVRVFSISAASWKSFVCRSGWDGKAGLPSFVTGLSYEARQRMLDTMLLGDGSKNGNSRVFTQNSGPVMEAFQILATLQGQRLSVERPHVNKDTTLHNKSVVGNGTCKRVGLINSKRVQVQKLTVTKLEGLHKVWCPTVSEGAVVARYNGQITITGNTTEGHPNVTSWFTTAPANAPYSGSVFLYRGHCVYNQTTRQIAEHINSVSTEKDRIVIWRNGHDGASERMSYGREFGLPFSTWKADRNRGIPQVRNYLEIRHKDEPHPFNKKLKGRPTLYLIVADDQLEFPKDDAGLARWREEFPVYHYKALVGGGLSAQVQPHPLFNDAMDTCFIKGTLITTKRGDIPIEEVTSDDLVLTRDGFKTTSGSWQTDKFAIVRKYQFSDGTQLTCTPNHPIYTNGEFTPIDTIRAHDILNVCKLSPRKFTQKLSRLSLLAVASEKSQPVYNLSVNEFPEYFANGILVHNCRAAGADYFAPIVPLSLDEKVEREMSQVYAGRTFQDILNMPPETRGPAIDAWRMKEFEIRTAQRNTKTTSGIVRWRKRARH